MKVKERKYQKGITLIALVITIIVLLILAGVTLSIVFNGGIINKSQTAVDKYSEESAKEKLSLAIFNYKMGKITGEAGEGEGQKTLTNYLAEIGGAITLEDDTTYTIELDGYEFNVNKATLEITSLGAATGEKPEIKGVTFDLVGEEHLSAIIKVTASATKGGALTVKIGNQTATLENGTYNLTVTNNGTYTIIVSENGLTRKAIGTVEVSGIEKVKYTVTLTAGAGIEAVTGGGQVEEGKSVTISATVASGYTFSKWNVTSGNASDVASLTSATTTVTPTGNITIEATAIEQAILNNINGTANAKVGSGDYAYNNPVVPVGFRTSNEGASWESTNGTTVDGWNDGLVIQDGSGNQFVWVPVDGRNVTYDYHYSVYSEGNTSLEQSLPTGISSEETQITEYGGFYIARYEAGIPSDGSLANTSSRDVSGIPVSKKNQVPWNYISWSQSKTNAASMYTLANTNNHVQSVLITDRMWETTMQWLEKANPSVNVTSNSIEWGNYKNAPVTGITEYSTNYGVGDWTPKTDSDAKGTSTSWLLKTGHTDYTKRKNIYDLAGNLWEWTNAKYSSSSSSYVLRGGSYGNDGTTSTAASRANGSDTGNNSIGFRVGLFVQ